MAPQFFKIILSPHASKLHIPDEFINKYGTSLGDLVVLEVPTGATWEVKLQNSNGMAWLKEGWNQFKEYYSIGCGYFLLFQYNGNSHFSVFIFDLSASEIEYPPGPNEDMTPENFVNIVGDASNREKANRPEAKNNACDEIVEDFPTGKTTKDNQVNACDEILDDLPTKKTAKDNQVNACHEILDDLPTKKTAKYNKVNSCDLPTNKTAKDKKVNACDEIMDDFWGNKTAKDDKVADDSYSRRNKSGVPASFPSCLPERQDPNRVKLEKPDMEEDLYCAAQKEKKQDTDKEKLEKQNTEKNLYCAADTGKGNFSKVLNLSACKMTNSNQCNKRKYSVSLEASHCRYPLRSKKAKVVKLEKQDVQQNLYCEAYKFKEHCNEVLVVACSPSKVVITNQQNERKATTSLDVSCSRYPVRSKQLREVKLEQQDASYKTMITSRRNEKEITTSLDASHCRYPLRNKQLKEVKLEQQDTASKTMITNQHNEMKIITSLDASYCRYPLRSKQLKEVKLEQLDAASKAMITNLHNEKKITTRLDASCCRYPLRSKQLKDVKLERREALGNMHSLLSKNTVADPSYCKRQKSSLLASSPSYQPERKEAKKVKLEKPDMEENLFCAEEKAKRKDANNVKLEKGDDEWNLNSAAYNVKEGCDDVTFAEKQLSTATSQVKRINLGEAQCSKLRNPYFIVSMQPTYVSRSFLLNIPLDFVKRYFKEESIVTLRVSDGRTWRVRCSFYSHCAKMHSPGWRDFVVDNNLKVHDTCDFELMEDEPVLHVTIFRATPAS